MASSATGRPPRAPERPGPPGGGGTRARLIGRPVQHLLAPLAVTGRVDHDPHGRIARRVAVRDLEGQVLDGVDRLAVAPDEEPQVVALERAADAVVAALHDHVGVEPEGLPDRLEQLLYAVCRLAHRRLPERFFFR